jgi:plastocyanin
LESSTLGIGRSELKPGNSKLLRFTAPTEPGRYEITLIATKAKALTIVVEEPAAVAPTAAPVREIKVLAEGFKFDLTSVTVRAGEKVRFVLTNNDTEKHNLYSFSASILSSDADSQRTTSYEWTAPSTPGAHKVICTYHPAMVFDLIVQ